MRGLALILLLSACTPAVTTEMVGCPASDGWTHEDHVRLMQEHDRFKKQFPESARALEEYQDLKPDRCAIWSGLTERN